VTRQAAWRCSRRGDRHVVAGENMLGVTAVARLRVCAKTWRWRTRLYRNIYACRIFRRLTYYWRWYKRALLPPPPLPLFAPPVAASSLYLLTAYRSSQPLPACVPPTANTATCSFSPPPLAAPLFLPSAATRYIASRIHATSPATRLPALTLPPLLPRYAPNTHHAALGRGVWRIW